MFSFSKTNKVVTQLNNLNAAINEEGGCSYMIAPIELSKNEFRGSLSEYIKNQERLSHVTDIILTGKQVRPGIFDSSVRLDPVKFSEFMDVINKTKIKKLDLTGTHLKAIIGEVLGRHLKTNLYLEELSVTTNDLKIAGILPLLAGLAKNQHLKKLYMLSANVARYELDEKELYALQEVIKNNRSLELIDLTDNQLDEHEDLKILIDAYLTNPINEFATITGLDLGLSSVPDINSKNIEKISQQYFGIGFKKSW